MGMKGNNYMGELYGSSLSDNYLIITFKIVYYRYLK